MGERSTITGIEWWNGIVDGFYRVKGLQSLD